MSKHSDQPIYIARNDNRFSEILRGSDETVSGLFLRGNADSLNLKSVSIVGTRKATSLGLKTAEEMAYQLGKAGFAIVSGLALGVDSAAHKGALRAGSPTIAVMGCGIDRIYPSQNAGLAHEIIINGGAVVSEYSDGSARKHLFLERNRITAGLSAATIIIESPYKSGTANIANWAINQGKNVFVVPGPVNHPNYAGSHALIRDGATLVTSCRDVLSDLGFEMREEKNSGIKLENETEEMIFGILKSAGEALSIDDIIERSELPASDVNTSLTMLSIRQIVSETPEGYTI